MSRGAACPDEPPTEANQYQTRCTASGPTPIQPDGTSGRASSPDVQKSPAWCMIRVNEGRFPVVAALAVHKEQDLFGHVTGQRIADSLLDEDPQGSVVAGNAFQELLEQRALGTAVGTHRCDLGQQIAGIVLLTPTGPQVDGAILDVEQPRIGNVETLICVKKPLTPSSSHSF